MHNATSLMRPIIDRFFSGGHTKPNSRLKVLNLTRQAVLGDSVEVADCGATRRKGLLGRSGLPGGEGLWIVPCESVHTFGMKFPIDLVYLDRRKRVKKVRSDVPPWRMSACLSAHSVLELASGTINKTHTRPGDNLEFLPAFPSSAGRIDPDGAVAARPEPANKQGTAMRMQARNFRAIAELLVVAICTAAFALTIVGIGSSVLESDAAGTRDFVEYWAAGYQLVHHSNPYDEHETILPMERAAGYPSGLPAFIMPNPPTALPLVAPLGLFGPKVAELLWLALSLGCLITSVEMIRTMHGSPRKQIHWLGYSFAPALSCLLSGQITIFILFGLALFLRLHRSWPFLAGFSLWFCLLKPHLFLPFGIALLVWIVVTRNYKILAGVASSIAISSVITFVLDPSAWAQYGQMMSSRRPDLLSIQCLSIVLRNYMGHIVWTQYLPVALGCVWAIAYFRKHRDDWDWMAHGSLLMLVSVLVAPYSWLMDQAILIPALLHAAYLTRSRGLIATLALASAAVEVGIFRGSPLLHSAFYLWTSPAWLAWYLYAIRGTSTRMPATLPCSLVAHT
jgi:uncharacterized protein